VASGAAGGGGLTLGFAVYLVFSYYSGRVHSGERINNGLPGSGVRPSVRLLVQFVLKLVVLS